MPMKLKHTHNSGQAIVQNLIISICLITRYLWPYKFPDNASDGGLLYIPCL
jgi:hypothetical protein